jgi:hypothetical protein
MRFGRANRVELQKIALLGEIAILIGRTIAGFSKAGVWQQEPRGDRRTYLPVVAGAAIV